MPEDLTKVSSLELLLRLVELLPERSFEQIQIMGSIAGLSTPEIYGNVPPPAGSSPMERARKVLSAILPKIEQMLPESPIVEELLKRYPS
jgi:hypothetical protein